MADISYMKEDEIDEEIQKYDIESSRKWKRPEGLKYKPYELYTKAVYIARYEGGDLTGHKEWDSARTAARLTAGRFLAEIKKICPEHFKHFLHIASSEMPD